MSYLHTFDELTPDDFETPDWDRAGKVHDWRNYVSDEIRAMWPDIPVSLKAAIARQSDAMANLEEWD